MKNIWLTLWLTLSRHALIRAILARLDRGWLMHLDALAVMRDPRQVGRHHLDWSTEESVEQLAERVVNLIQHAPHPFGFYSFRLQAGTQGLDVDTEDIHSAADLIAIRDQTSAAVRALLNQVKPGTRLRLLLIGEIYAEAIKRYGWRQLPPSERILLT